MVPVDQQISGCSQAPDHPQLGHSQDTAWQLTDAHFYSATEQRIVTGNGTVGANGKGEQSLFPVANEQRPGEPQPINYVGTALQPITSLNGY